MIVERRFLVIMVALLLLALGGIVYAAPVTEADIAYIKAKLETGRMLTDSDVALIEQINSTTSNYYDVNEAQERAKAIAEGERQESQPIRAPRTRGTLDEYAWAPADYDWIDISETGTAVTPGDDSSYGPFDLGFTFTFYDQPFTQVRFCSNGFLNFGASATTLSNTAIPNTLTPNNAIYPFWDDLDAGTTTLPTGQIKYYADADNQRFVVSWLAVPHYYINGSNTYNYTFQCVLYANGNILFQYQNVQMDTIPGDTSCTVGIENGTGTQALQICFNGTGTLPVSNSAILINQPSGIPTNVTNLQGQASDLNVTLTWQDPTVDTYGNPLTPDNIEVWLSAIGAPGTLLGTVGPGTQSYTYTAPSAGNYVFWVRAENDGYYSPGVSVSVIVETPSYNEDFEADNGGWTPTGPLWQWGAPVVTTGGHAPHSGTNCWGTNLAGNYPASSCDHLELSPNLTVASPTATIEFWYWVDTELTYDGANLKVSVDNGATWTLVTPNGGYPRASLSTLNACIPSQPAWAGRDSTWRYTVLPIGDFIGQTPIFRISFGSDPSVHYRGFMLDDMLIWGLQSPAGVPAAPTNLAGNYAAPNVNLTWTDPTVDLLGSPVILTNLEVWLGPAVTGQLLGTVMPGTQSYTHMNPPFGHLNYSVRAYANSMYGPSVTIPITAGAPTYAEDFETTNGLWVPSPETGGWEWGAPVVPTGGHAPHSGTNCWGTVLAGPYTASACWYLELNPGLMVNSPLATMEFWYWVDSELSYDGANLKVSVDNGTTWTLVTPDGGYPRASLSTANTCMASQPAWAGRDSTWRHTVLPIGQFIGQSPIFRLTFGSDPSVHYRGFMFDDVEIWGLQSPAGVPDAPTNLAGNYISPNTVLTWTDPTVDLLGSPVILTNLEVWLGPVVTGTLLGTVMPGVQTFSHTNPPFGHLNYSVRAVANTFSGRPASVPVTAGTPTYAEGFETSNGLWVPSPETGGFEWGAPVFPVGGPVPHGGNNCWGTVLSGTYPASCCFTMDLNLGLQVNSPSATMEFWYWYDVETTWDGCNLKASIDNGATWTTLTPNGGYPVASLQTANACIPSQPAWAGGRDSTWRYAVVPISQFIGQAPIFRFSFGSDGSGQYRGFFFDDVEIWGLALPVLTPVSGRVDLDGQGGNVANAIVRSNGIGNPEAHPLADSTYSVSVQTGNRTIIASLAGFHNDTVWVTVGDTPVTNQNFVLRRLNPVAPTGFTASVNTATGIVTLNWDDSPDLQIDRYKVYRKLRNDADWVFRKEVIGRTNSGTTDTLTVGGIYQYRVTALDYDVVPPAVESDPSATVELAYGALPPHSLAADTAYDNRIVLSWLDPLALPEAELFYDGGENQVQGIGFWNATTPLQFGWLVTKYTRPTSTTVTRIKHYFTDDARAGDIYQVGVFADSTNGRPSLIVQGMVETNIPGPGQWHIVTLTTPVTIPSGVFYIGARQMAAAPPSICIGGDTLTPFQNSTFYYCGTSTSGWTSYEPNLMAIPMQRCIVRTAAGQELELSPEGPLAPMTIGRSVPMNWKTGEKFERRLVTDETEMKSETILPVDMPSVKQVHTRADMPPRRYLPYAVAHMPKQMPFAINERGNRTLDDVIRYIIYRGGTRRDSVAGTVTTYSDVVGSNNENVAYTYTVTARYDNNQESPVSNSITARCGMPPAQPTNGSLTRVGETSVRIQWTDPTVNADGTPCVDLAGVRVYRDGVFLTTVGTGVGQYLDQGLTPATRYEWMLITVDEVPLLGEPYILNGVAGNPSYDASFETDNGGWVATPATTGWEWGPPTAADGPTPHSGNNVWGTVLGGDYIDGACWYLDLNLGLEVQSPSARVEFFAWYWTERTYDGVNFKVSVDNGQTWTVVAPDQGYPLASLSATWNRCGTGTQPAWSGDSSEAWSLWTIPLNLFQGQTPIFRFDFTSDSLSVEYPGFYIDDLTIWGLSPASGVTGVVRKFGTNTPLENATVAVPGVGNATTDAQGNYRLGLEPGTYAVTYSHPHHCDSTITGVVVADGQVTVRDMWLKAPTASFSRTSLQFIAGQNSTRIDSFSITNNGQCPLQFTITDTSAWLSAQPTTGTVQVGSPVWITVRATTGTRPAGDYESRLFIAYNAIGTPYSMRIDLDIDLAVDPLASLPTEFAYHQNYPNPFNAVTALRFDVPQQSRVQIAIFNVMGQEVARPVDDVYVAGRHQILFDAGDLPSGMYLVKMTAGDFTKNGKMLLLK
ncbi:T9SS C-terminal target domain-containing protein [candidate division KSB1 bacterium]|nr:MAG: T9SS C-terminal target domain-containing protein [candidate division KSB1 bacterium]